MDTIELVRAYVGTTQVSRLYLGSELVWPVNYTYNIVNATAHFSSGSFIDAGVVGSQYSGNYLYFTGTVRLQRGQTVISETTEYLVPTVSNTSDFNVIYESSLGYYVVRGNNLGTIPTSSLKTTTVSVTFATSASYTIPQSFVQERNIETEGTPTTERVNGTPTVTTEDYDYNVYINATSYASSSNPAPASGGSTILTYGASHTERQTTVTPWTDVTTPHYNYTSGATRDGTPYISDSGSTTTYGTPVGVQDTPTISGSATGFSRSGSTVTIESRRTTPGQLRSVTYTASNGSASPMSVSIYQEANAIISTVVEPHLELAWDYSGSTFPGDGGVFGVTYRSEAKTTYTYTSRESTESSEPITSNVTSTNCTPSVNTVSGYGGFSVTIARAGSSRRWVFCRITEPTSQEYISISKQQEAYVPPVQNVATFEPYIWANPPQGSPYVRGYVYYLLTIMSGSVSQSTFTNVYLHWQVDGGLEQSLYLGDVSVSETTTEYGILVPSSGATIPTFTSGTIKAWFTITGNGDFDTVNAGQNYYCEVTL